MHVLGSLVARGTPGTPLFEGISPSRASFALKHMLGQIGVPKAEQHRTHDLRRGRAKDLELSGWRVGQCVCLGRPLCAFLAGAPLWEILAAGEWRSPAFMDYMDLHKLETDLVVQAHADESESEDEEN